MRLRSGMLCVLAALLLPLSPVPAAEAPGRVEQEAFTYESPAGWTVFKDEKLSNFSLLGFYNADGEVLQLSVSGKLSSEQYAGARSRLQTVDRQSVRRGWTLAAATIFELPPYGTVSESVHYDNAYSLTSYSYNVFGPERIALFTITFKGIKPDAADAARKLVGGLQWK